MQKSFASKIIQAVNKKQSVTVVGIDPTIKIIPPEIISDKYNIEQIIPAFKTFCMGIIDAVQDLVPAVKPNIAFFEAYGSQGIKLYNEICQYAKKLELIVIGDVKRGDIGSTAQAYAQGLLEDEIGEGMAIGKHDAITLNPYLGYDGIKPFVDIATKKQKGMFVLVKTSNQTSAEIQDLKIESGETVADRVASLVNQWGKNSIDETKYSAVGAVVGATHGKELEKFRKLMPNTIFLIPGYGAQGGTAEDVVCAFQKNAQGAVVNASRSIINAWEKMKTKDWKMAARKATINMNEDIKNTLKKYDKWII